MLPVKGTHVRLGKQKRSGGQYSLKVRAVGHKDVKVPGVPQIFVILFQSISTSSSCLLNLLTNWNPKPSTSHQASGGCSLNKIFHNILFTKLLWQKDM